MAKKSLVAPGLSASTRRRLIMSITRVASNTNAYYSAAELSKLDNGLTSTLNRLSTGLRINSAADDPAGVVTSATLRSRVSNLDQAIQNTQEAIGFTSTVDGYISQSIDILTRMKDIAVEGGNNATMSQSQADNLRSEYNNLVTQLQVIDSTAKYGAKSIFDGSFSAAAGATFQTGIGLSAQLTIVISGLWSAISGGTGLSTFGAANTFMTGAVAASAYTMANQALSVVTNMLGSVGVQSRRLDLIVSTLEDERANAIAANSSVSDADLAAEITNLATAQIRAQAATAAMAQANAFPQMIAQLLNGM